MNRKALHYTSVAVLLFLSALFLYFYLTGRIERYVAPEFRTWALAAGLGLAVLGLFNLVTARAAVDCGHDHSHDHGDEHDHDHSHDEGACSDHSHDHEHDHSHDHGHHHGTGEEEEHHHHEDSPAGIVLALVVLTLPMLVAANYSRDTFSPEYQIRWADITENLQRIEAKRKIKREQAVGGPSIADRPPSTAVSPTGTGVTDENPGAPVGADVAAADTPPTTANEGTEGQVGGTAGESDAAAATDADDDGWGEFTIEDLKRMVPQSSEGNFLLEVPQLFYTANDTELQRVLEGLPIETIAQVMPISKDTQEMNPDAATRRLRLFRMFVECCAADMRPLPVTIEFKDGIPTYEEMGWVKVVGKVRYEHVDGVTAPIVDVISIEPTAEPMDMMVY